MRMYKSMDGIFKLLHYRKWKMGREITKQILANPKEMEEIRAGLEELRRGEVSPRPGHGHH